MREGTLLVIFAVTLILAILIGTMYDSYSTNKQIEFSVKAGLEQCPNPEANVNSKSVIWVKDCNAFTATMRENAKVD